jgi:hypothetical protein
VRCPHCGEHVDPDKRLWRVEVIVGGESHLYEVTARSARAAKAAAVRAHQQGHPDQGPPNRRWRTYASAA